MVFFLSVPNDNKLSKMENALDIEEIVPPTPEIQLNKFCSRIDKTSVQTSKLSRKALKNDSYKRKRIISPDFKKVKQKARQVTLYKFLMKGKNSDTASCSNICSSHSSIKINLLDKFKNSEQNKTDQISSSINPVEEVSCIFETELSNQSKSNETEVSHSHDEQKVIEIDQISDSRNQVEGIPEAELSHQTKKNEIEICEEVALLHLSSQKGNIGCSLLADNDSLNASETVENNPDVHMDEKFIDVDESFSWMTDMNWENDKENFTSNVHSVIEDTVSSPIKLDVREDSYIKFKVKEVQRDSSMNQVKLTVAACDNSAVIKTCLLRGFWVDSIINVGDTVHILKSSADNPFIIENESGFLVTNPDFLLSSTAVVSTLFCMRKAALNHILPQWSPGNDIMMIGSLIHDIFQKSVNSHVSTSDEILKIVKLVLKKRENLIALCFQALSEMELEEKLCRYIPNILDWIKKHCSFHGKNSFESISITNVEDIEENVWCPKYGVKGKIDMTVRVQSFKESGTKIMPLELKTGRPTFSAEHMGQVNLYSMMMEERSKQVSDGLLLYLRDKAEMKVINANHHSKRGLIQLRNELASYIYKWVYSSNSDYDEIEQCYLPKPINNKRMCEKCPYLLPCSLYQKAFSEVNTLDASHAMSTLIPASTSHLTASHIEYFLHWSRLLMLENTTTTEVKAFWTEDATSRERKGMCLSFVVLDKKVTRQEGTSEYFVHTFIRSSDNPVSPDFKNSCLKEGDYVAISNQNNIDEVAIAMGYTIVVHDHSIEVAIERNLGSLSWLNDCIFRIDKITSNSAAACVRSNLMLLMQEENQAKKLRKFIIDIEEPKFLQALPKQIVLMGRPILKCLNKNQQKAVLKAIMAEDYFLIKGMPGTGKTSTIIALVRLLVKMNASILLASYTHSAIDNILLKLKEHVEFIRLGPKYRIHPDIMKYSFENLTQDFTSTNQFSTFMKEQRIVATSCLGINHAIFKLRKFDVCIVDEAAQINQIACLGPLFFAKKFILVGDDKQLPPLVLNAQARKKGMQESLFQRLQNNSNCMELIKQYRMNKEIMRLCNVLTYTGALECGNDAVANNTLQLQKKSAFTENMHPSWLLLALSTDLDKSVVFINTDKYKTAEVEKSRTDIEAGLVILLVQFLIQSAVSETEIGIIAPYRKQVDLIETKLKDLKLSGIEVNTVDQYQGRDKDVIIISCIRPSDSQPKAEKSGVILDDERRLNVAITRAKTKLILIGNKAGLFVYKPFKDLINCLRSDQVLDVI